MLKRTLAWALLAFFISFPIAVMSEGGRMKYPPLRDRRPCKPVDRCWVEAEYLFWRLKDTPEPVPLIIKGQMPSARVVLGGNSISTDWRSGGKIGVGYWFDKSRQLGGEVSYSFIPTRTKKQIVSSDGSPGSSFLFVPYINVNNGIEQFAGVASPGFFAGTAKLDISNWMTSSEANVIAVLPGGYSMNLIWIAGLRYWGFEETLSLKTDSPNVPPLPADVYKTTDHFKTENHFYGGQVGIKVEYTCCGFFANSQLKLAVGTMHQKSVISGKLKTNDFNDQGPIETFPGGYFTMPSNIKTRKTECYTIIPEAGVNLGYKVADCFKIQVGYTILYVNNVLRPGSEISRKINPTQSTALSNVPNPVLVGEGIPKNRLKSSSFFAQGLNAGIEFSF